MEHGDRRDLGKWYTPAQVADLALALALAPDRAAGPGFGAAPRSPGPRIIDPCCGDGAFLARARERGVPADALFGLDLDADAVARARERLPGAAIACGDIFDPMAVASGFDAVVGNPPYVRQERIPAAHKTRIRALLSSALPGATPRDIERLTARGDLAAACVVRAVQLARPGARIALVVSSALLSADYAAALWRTVALLGQVRAIVDAPDERWFADAAVNPLIVLIERHPLERDTPLGAAAPAVIVARLRVSTAQAARALGAIDDLARLGDVRKAPAHDPERWLAYTRAPAVFFELEARARGALAPLGALAEIRRGVTSNANQFYYVSRARAQALGLESELLMPLLRSPRGHRAVLVRPETCPDLAVVCPSDPARLERYPAMARYVASHAELADKPSLRARSPWFSLPVNPARLFLTKAYAARFVQHLSSAPMVADQRFYTVTPRPDVCLHTLAAVLNSTFTILALECMGRASMGAGALEWTVADARRLPVLDPRRLDPRQGHALGAALDVMAERPMGTVHEERSAADRRALDLALAAIRPGLADLVPAIWPALITAVDERSARISRRLGA